MMAAEDAKRVTRGERFKVLSMTRVPHEREPRPFRPVRNDTATGKGRIDSWPVALPPSAVARRSWTK